MKCSFGICNFLEEISSLSHSIVFLYVFALIAEEGFLISPCYSLETCIQMGISFLFFFAFHFSSQISSVELLSSVWLFATPWVAERQASLSITSSQSLLSHVRCVSDAIQPSYPLSSPSSPAFNLSQHQGLFKWVSSSHQVAKVLEFQLQHQSFQWLMLNSWKLLVQ